MNQQSMTFAAALGAFLELPQVLFTILYAASVLLLSLVVLKARRVDRAVGFALVGFVLLLLGQLAGTGSKVAMYAGNRIVADGRVVFSQSTTYLVAVLSYAGVGARAVGWLLVLMGILKQKSSD